MTSPPAGIAWGPVVDGLSMGIHLDEKLHRGQPIMLLVFARNEGRAEAAVTETHPLADYDLNVVARGIGPVPMTDVGRKTRGAALALEAARRTWTRLPPGEVRQLHGPLPLHEWIQLDRTGDFVVAVSQRQTLGLARPLSSGEVAFRIVDEPSGAATRGGTS